MPVPYQIKGAVLACFKIAVYFLEMNLSINRVRRITSVFRAFTIFSRMLTLLRSSDWPRLAAVWASYNRDYID
jgi:hypothetical protein